MKNYYILKEMKRILEDILEEEKRHTTFLKMNVELIKMWMLQDKQYHDKTLKKLEGGKKK